MRVIAGAIQSSQFDRLFLINFIPFLGILCDEGQTLKLSALWSCYGGNLTPVWFTLQILMLLTIDSAETIGLSVNS